MKPSLWVTCKGCVAWADASQGSQGGEGEKCGGFRYRKILSFTYVKHNSSIPHLATCTYSDGHENVSNQEVISIHPNRYYTPEGLNPGCVSPLQFLRSNESRSAQAPSSDGCAGKANCGGTEPGKKFIPNIPHRVTWQSAGFTLPGSAHFLMTTFLDILDPAPVPSIPRRNRNRFLGKVLAPRPGITNASSGSHHHLEHRSDSNLYKPQS
jgi:hypothetical protein